MPSITADQVRVPADVPASARGLYVENYLKATRGTGRLMLFACDQKVEHLNDDFYGEGIDPADNDPEHLFKIGSQGVCGILAGQRGLISQYAADYPQINYLVKMNSKTHLVHTSQEDPYSPQLYDLQTVLDLMDNGVNVVGIGYTIYLGSEYESTMMTEAAQLIADAHANGLIVVLWIYPRGKAVPEEQHPHIIAGATGLGATLGADFCKVNYPKPKEGSPAEAFKEAVQAAGRTRVITAGGSSTDVRKFLQTLHDQIFISGAYGSATGRNIHQKPLHEAIQMTNAISAITYGGHSVDEAMAVYDGKEKFSL